MTRSWVSWSLRTRIALAVSLLLAAIIALPGWWYARHADQAFHAALAERQMAVALRMAGEVQARVELQRASLIRFAAALAREGPVEHKLLSKRLAAFGEVNAAIADVVMLSPDGIVQADYPMVRGRVGANLGDRDYMRRVRAGEALVVSKPLRGRFSGEPLVMMVVPVGADNDFLGFVGVAMRLSSPHFLGPAVNGDPGPGGYLKIVTEDGVVVAHNDARHVLHSIPPGQNPALDRARAGFEGTAYGVNLAGQPTLYSFKRVAATNWLAVVAYPGNEAGASLAVQRRDIVAYALLLAVSGGLAAWWLITILLAPLARLRDAIDGVTAGTAPATGLVVRSAGEIGDLGSSFNRMLESLAEARAARDASDRRLASLLRQFDVLYERAPLGLALLREDGGLARANPAFCRIVGRDQEALVRLKESELGRAGQTEADARAYAALAAGGVAQGYEKEYATPDGRAVPVRVSGVAIGDAGSRAVAGDEEQLLGWWIVEDIATRKQMIEALRQSESEARMLSAVARHTGNFVIITDAEGRIEWVNRAFEQGTGYALDEARGQTPSQLLVGPETDRATDLRLQQARVEHQAFAAEILNHRKDGSTYWCLVEGAPVFDHLGRLERYVAIERDITEARQLDEDLKESEARFRDLTALSSDWFWEMDADFRMSQVSGDAVGRGLAAPVGVRPWENPLSMLDDHQWGMLRQALERRETFREFESPLRLPGGEVRWRSMSGAPMFTADGAFAGYRGVGRDITAQKLAEEALRLSEEQYRRIFEDAQDAIFELDREGTILLLNPTWERRTGFPVADCIGRSFFDFLAPSHRDLAQRELAAMMSGSRQVLDERVLVKSAASGERWHAIRGRVYLDAAGEMRCAGTLQDVHDRRLAEARRLAAEAELRVAQQRFQRAVDGSNDGVWERTLATDEFFLSDRFGEILGLPRDDLPTTRHEWLTLIHPQDMAEHMRVTQRMLDDRRSATWDVRMRHATGEYRWLRLRGIVSFDAAGVPSMTSGTASDIHAAKLAEEELHRHRDHLSELVAERTVGLEKARREAEAAREVAVRASLAKSEFLANMSHELRTPMHAILSFASFGVERGDRVERDKLMRYFGNIKKSGTRLLELLNTLLDLSKLEAGRMEMRRRPVVLADLIDDAVEEVEALARAKGIRIETHRGSCPSRVSLDGLRMSQVIRNLLSNAVKFTGQGGAVEVCCGMSATDRDTLEISVRDSGIGIPEDELEAVFDKFVQSSKTTTGAGGTGLGLAICREIVAAHGGSIRAANNLPPAPGAIFRVCLPVALPIEAATAESTIID
ncbi:MAG: PAS domain S-box protein [Burkholderiales bacterium]|nr:PAS domain S-box protein [Burkholderiales bacterium]